MHRLIVLRIAAADLWHDRRIGLCTVLAIAALLAPLLALAGLRAGVVTGLRDVLLKDPNIRQIQSAANHEISRAILRALADRPDVAFLVPRTRTLAASLLIELPGGPQQRIELIPSALGDPLLPGGAPALPGSVVLSAAAAARLGVKAGAALNGRLVRSNGDGRLEVVTLPLHVQAVAPAHSFAREGGFVTLLLANYVEDFQDGRVGPVNGGLDTLPAADRGNYAGFRLYAKRLEDVPSLDAALRGQGLDISSRAGDVAGLLALDANLGLLLWLVAGLAGTGYLLSLGAGLWVGVERRRGSFAILRLLGFSGRTLALLPIMQSLALAVGGVALASVMAFVAAGILNRTFHGTLGLDQPLCRLSWAIIGAAAMLTTGGAGLAALAAGVLVGRVEPWEGLR